jgi:hypothetical protein
MFERDDIISNFPEIVRAALHHCSGFGGQQFTQGGLGPFDLAGQNRLSPEEGAHENMGIGKTSPLRREFADQSIRVREFANQPSCPLERGRKRRR